MNLILSLTLDELVELTTESQQSSAPSVEAYILELVRSRKALTQDKGVTLTDTEIGSIILDHMFKLTKSDLTGILGVSDHKGKGYLLPQLYDALTEVDIVAWSSLSKKTRIDFGKIFTNAVNHNSNSNFVESEFQISNSKCYLFKK